MQYYVILKRDGQIAGCCEDDAKLPKGAVETSRLPEAFEKWDSAASTWVKDSVALSDAARESTGAAILDIATLPKQLNDLRLWLAAVGLPCPIPEIAARFERIDAIRADANSNKELT